MSLLNNQKFLQNAIIVMSILILAGLAILVHGIVKKSGVAGGNIAGNLGISAPDVEAPDGTKTVLLPYRSNVRNMASYNGGIALFVSNHRGNFVYFVNSKTGEVEGALKIDTAPTAAPQKK